MGKQPIKEGAFPREGRRGGPSPAAFTVTVSQVVVLQAGLVVELEAQVVLLALGSGLPGASAVSQPPEG